MVETKAGSVVPWTARPPLEVGEEREVQEHRGGERAAEEEAEQDVDEADREP